MAQCSARGRRAHCAVAGWVCRRHRRANEPLVFMPLPASAFQSAARQQVAIRHVSARFCRRRAARMRSSASSRRERSTGAPAGRGTARFHAGGAADSVAGDVVDWVHERGINAATVPLLRTAIGDSDWCVRRLAAPILGRVSRSVRDAGDARGARRARGRNARDGSARARLRRRHSHGRPARRPTA